MKIQTDVREFELGIDNLALLRRRIEITLNFLRGRLNRLGIRLADDGHGGHTTNPKSYCNLFHSFGEENGIRAIFGSIDETDKAGWEFALSDKGFFFAFYVCDPQKQEDRWTRVFNTLLKRWQDSIDMEKVELVHDSLPVLIDGLADSFPTLKMDRDFVLSLAKKFSVSNKVLDK